MQTQNLLIPTLNANTASATKGNLNLGAGGENNAFKQALSREMDQRQGNANNNAEARAVERPASRSSAPKQAQAPAQAKPAQQANQQNRSDIAYLVPEQNHLVRH